MGAHQQLQLAVDQILQQAPAAGRGGGAGEQGRTDMQLGQPFGQLAVVLLGEHFGGRHQRPLAPRFDRGEQGGQGHDGLAAAHIPLHQPGHRLGTGQVGANLRQHPLLRPGERKGQQGQEALHQSFPPGRQGQGGSGALAELASALGQAQLQQQELIEHQAAAARLQLLLIGRSMDSAQGLGAGDQALAAAQGLGQGIRPVAHQRQDRFHHLAQAVGTEAICQPIHGQQPADGLGAHRSLGGLQHLHQGILEGWSIGRLLHQTTHRHGGPGGELALLGFEPAWAGEALAGKKPAHPNLPGAIHQMQFENGEIGVARAGEGVAAAHGGHDRGGAPRLQTTDPHEVGVVEVVARVVVHKVAHQQQPQLGQAGCGFGSHPPDLR